MDLYEPVYAISGVFWIYVVFKFMDIFFDTSNVNKKVHISSYILYYVISMAVYFLVKIPIVFGVVNVLAFFALTFNYQSSVTTKLIATAMIYFTSIVVESLVAIGFGHLNFVSVEFNSFSSVFGIIVMRILIYIVVLVINNFINLRTGMHISKLHWFTIIMLPLSSLFICLMLFNTHWINTTSLLICLAILLLINFLSFYLYDAISKSYLQKIEHTILEEKIQSYEKQFDIISESIKTTRIIRHDFKNHLAVIRHMVKEQKTIDCLEYVDNLFSEVQSSQFFFNSGNIVVDSILNFKLEKAMQNGTRVKTHISIPVKPIISSHDMTIILGNLIDNAIEATENQGEEGLVDIKIKMYNGKLSIKISNTLNTEISLENNHLITTKSDSENHGYGINSVQRALKKYNGNLSFRQEQNLFISDILLFID